MSKILLKLSVISVLIVSMSVPAMSAVPPEISDNVVMERVTFKNRIANEVFDENTAK